uniref:Uncharacterized protein n=1 Tax=Arundo donax TaxID=35708 RepID=A0A0A9AG94_ARUDO
MSTVVMFIHSQQLDLFPINLASTVGYLPLALGIFQVMLQLFPLQSSGRSTESITPRLIPWV